MAVAKKSTQRIWTVPWVGLALLFGPLFAVRVCADDDDGIQIGDPIATTVQLPTFGVSFDADGVLQLQTFDDPTGRLGAQRVAAARAALGGNLARPVAFRKVSIVRLQTALLQLLRDGKQPTDTMQKLAGLTRITTVFCYPDLQDIVLAGPAEPWAADLSERTVGIRSGLPTLLLEDLVTALRAYRPGLPRQVFVGCTISPRPEGLAKLMQFQRTIPRRIAHRNRGQVTRQVALGVRESLGMADVKVFGISASTHFARVMIEADYRMKRIAIGVERPPVRLTTYAAAMTTARSGVLERWWFTPDYEGVQTSPDRLVMQITGQGVQLRTENKQLLDDGTIARAAYKPSRATRAYATSFTKRYGEIANSSPVYAQLRQLTDLLIVAAFMRRHEWYERASWNANELLDEAVYPINTLAMPVSAPVVVNAFWKQNRMFTPAGGGVSIEAEKAIAETMEIEEQLAATRAANVPPENTDRWWWD